MKTKLFITIIMSSFIFIASAQIIHVPEDHSSIQAGINAASNGDTVLVAHGTFYENVRFNGKAITVASEFITENDSSHILNTIIDGSQASNPDSAATVMFVNNEDTTSIIYGFTITGGSGVLYLNQARNGGGIYCENAGAKILNNIIIENNLSHDNKAGGGGIGCRAGSNDQWIIIRNNIISNNITNSTGLSAFGGGIYSSSNTIIENNLIENNKCINMTNLADGGGIEIEQLLGYNILTKVTANEILNNILEGNNSIGGGMVVAGAEAEIIDNIIKYNDVTAENNGNGGGIWIDTPLDICKLKYNDISDNTITAGNYGRGGGIVFWNPMSEIIMIGNKINNNITEADECRGSGALFRCNQYPTGEIHVLQNEFIGNLGNLGANGCNGGGVCLNDAWDTLVIFDGNRFEANSAINGGGLYSRRSYNIQLINNLFISNTSSIAGGAIRLLQHLSNKKANLHPQLINNTFYNNSSDYGGAINLYCETNVPVIFNNIFWENQSPISNDIYYDNSGIDSIIVSYNNIDLNEVHGLWKGTGNILGDPLFSDTLYHINECESPCKNAGVETLEAYGSLFYCPIKDFDNTTRPYLNTSPDIGADETPCLETSSKNYLDRSHSNNYLSIYPNPVIEKTTIEFYIMETEYVILTLVNATGNDIQNFVSKKLPIGNHQIEWNSKELPEGIYFCILKTNAGIQTKKIIKL